MIANEPPIAKPSSSPWASDVVLIKKKDGNLRFAVDYRRLNAVTKRDEYSLPNPNSIFDKLQGSTIFSKLDVASAYWTIPIRAQDTEKTAFHTPRGLFEMLVIPFGLCNSQATFQRVMDQVSAGLAMSRVTWMIHSFTHGASMNMCDSNSCVRTLGGGRIEAKER